jgi:transposase, IS30 family
MAHLTLEQRYKIETLLANKVKQKAIAAQLGLSESTISKEKNRNNNQQNIYSATHAHRLSLGRKKHSKPYKFTKHMAIAAKILLGGTPLEKFHSPEQIIGTMKKENKAMVSHETLYQWIDADKKNGGNFYQKLRQKHKNRRKRLNEKDRRGIIPNKVMLEQRPEAVNNKERYGDWEGDTIIGAAHQGAILTLVERKSRFTYIEKLDAKTAKCVAKAIINFFKRTGMPCESITFDNGKEWCDTSLYKSSSNHKSNRRSNLFCKSIPCLGKRL